jgi:multicomponent Na+:H+ antiporter subunit G
MEMTETAGAILLLAGSVAIFIGSLGLLRLPNYFSRLHSAGVVDTLGAWLILLGLLVMSDSLVIAFKLLLIVTLLFLLFPVASHALARAGKEFGLRIDRTPDADNQFTGSEK